MQTTTIPARRSLEGIDHFAMRLDEPPPALHLRAVAVAAAAGPHARVIVFACAIMVLAALGAGLVLRSADARVPEIAPATAESAAPPPASNGWVEIRRPIPLFELAGSDFERLPLAYRARRREQANERQDFLTYGHFGAGPFLALSVLRKTSASPLADVFVDMARLAADEALSVARSAQPTVLATRFGPFAIADVTLARSSRSVACLGFRLGTADAPTSAIEIGGFACGTPDHGMDRALLGCVLDRIDLLSAGEDAVLQDFFVAAERRRGQLCTASRLLAAGSKGLWLDADATPPALRRLNGARSHSP